MSFFLTFFYRISSSVDNFLHNTDKHIEPVYTQLKKERRKSWKERNGGDNGAPEEDDPTEILSVSSYLSATSKGMSSVKSLESVNDTKSMVTAVSGSIEDEERAMTPTEDDVGRDAIDGREKLGSK
uniref:Uncharacterized protein n=1 Tax=Heterorhabditis bacteriophora TaxID=37862 RepID=A0A1I7X460_HETBA